MATELVAQHPAETWQILGGALAAVIALTGIIYNRLNKDIDAGDTRQEEYRTQTDKRINDQARELEGISSNVGTLVKQVEEIFKKLTAGAESFSSVREDLRELETRIEGIMRELEQKAGSHNESIKDLRQELAELKKVISHIDRRCFSMHPGIQQ